MPKKKSPCVEQFRERHGHLPRAPFLIEAKRSPFEQKGFKTLASAKRAALNATEELSQKIKIFDTDDNFVMDADGDGFIC